MRYSSVIEYLCFVIMISIVCGETTTTTTTALNVITESTTFGAYCLLRNIQKSTVPTIKDKCADSTEIMSVQNSNLEEVPDSIFNYFKRLKVLVLSSAHIWSIKRDTFVNAKTLEVLVLNNNNFESLENDLFRGADNLSEIEITGSQILTVAEHAFRNLRHLKKLDLSKNRISNLHHKLFENLANLKELRMEHNNIQILNGLLFFHNKAFSALYMAWNNLIDIDENLFQSTIIKFIDIPNNPGLRKFDLNVKTLRNIKELVLTNTGLTELVIPTNAIEIHANKNNIKKIRVSYDEKNNHLPQLQILDLSENELTDLSGFRDLDNIVELNLDDNELHEFKPQDLSGKHLKELGLERNRFEWNLEAHDIISNLPKLTTLRVTAIKSSLYLQEKLKRDLAKTVNVIISTDTEPPTIPPVILDKFLPNSTSNDYNSGDSDYDNYNNNNQDKQLPALNEFPSMPTNTDIQDPKKIKELTNKFNLLEKLMWELKSYGKVDDVPKISGQLNDLKSFTYWSVGIIFLVILIIIFCMGNLHFDYVKAKYRRFRSQHFGNRREVDAFAVANNQDEEAELDEFRH